MQQQRTEYLAFACSSFNPALEAQHTGKSGTQEDLAVLTQVKSTVQDSTCEQSCLDCSATIQSVSGAVYVVAHSGFIQVWKAV